MKVTINDKMYELKYTRRSICQAEDAFGISMINREEPKTFKDTMIILKAMLYGALCTSIKNLKAEDMDDLYDIFTGEGGFEQEGLVEGLQQMMVEAINPTGGKRQKKLFSTSKKS